MSLAFASGCRPKKTSLCPLGNGSTVAWETRQTSAAAAAHALISTDEAMIAASTLHASCDTLWSEDMQHGMMLGEGLQILNPFRAAE